MKIFFADLEIVGTWLCGMCLYSCFGSLTCLWPGSSNSIPTDASYNIRTVLKQPILDVRYGTKKKGTQFELSRSLYYETHGSQPRVSEAQRTPLSPSFRHVVPSNPGALAPIGPKTLGEYNLWP